MAERVGPTQIENRNFLAPVGFRFNLQRSPGVAYFCNQANIPDISLGVATQPNYLRDLPTPGDKMDFGDLSLRFLVDEDLKNYMEIQKWMRGLGFPESLQQFEKFEKGVNKFSHTQKNLFPQYIDLNKSDFEIMKIIFEDILSLIHI